ncbi:kinase-like domain-containing protein, partial [Cristinia sonorae]
DGSNPDYHQFVSGHRHVLRRLLVKICRDTESLPATLFLNDIKCDSFHSVAGGSFADIYHADYDGSRVALKRLRVFQADPSHRAEQFKAFCREALVWRQLRHPYVLSFLGVDTKTFEPSGLHCMVSPWMENGSISDLIAKQDGSIGRWVLDKWVYEIAEGLSYLHDERVVHGDLRGANILVDSKFSIKLSDFGLAKFADASTASWGTHTAGALRWMAPEVLSGLTATFASDVYSFGCVCSELYTSRRPFSHVTNDAHVVFQIIKGARPEMPAITGRYADILRPLVITCWNGSPSTRPNAKVLADTLRPSAMVKDE